ncbi:hypothetical protein DL769_001325 [Monosporascus sp. CRB-8-3]|nr:hypothetical protein DL769_001325 [Monosporascus sp. CRB-8-3]
MDIPVLLISARLSSPSVLHLLEKTDARVLLVSRRTRKLLSTEVGEHVDVKVVSPYAAFIHEAESSGGHSSMRESIAGDDVADSERHWRTGPAVNEKNRNVIILHSSGTTGLPKPIYMAHRYLLGYAACHEFDPTEDVTWVSMSTLPLYHGFGLLAPCLSLSVGMTCLFPPSSIIPAAHSTLELIEQFQARSLMTVPSIVDDIVTGLDSKKRRQAMELLAKLNFVAVGGGALNPSRAATLAQHDVKLLNHYGVTEIGAIAPIFRPGPDYDWRYLRLRTDLGLQLHPIEGSPHFRLVGFPCGWDGPFQIQDELERNPGSKRVEVRILGRTDDLIVLKTGEKVMPRKVEEVLNEDPAIKTSVCIGQGFFEVIVLIESVSDTNMDTESLQEHVWNLVSGINPTLDQHARISSKEAIIVKPASKRIPRSDKGSVMRREVHELFKEEIDAAYSAMEANLTDDSLVLNAADIETSIHTMMKAVAPSAEQLSEEDDFFENGMDSLQAVRLVRVLNSALSRMDTPNSRDIRKLTPEFIYHNPSIAQLATAIERILTPSELSNGVSSRDRDAEMRALADELLSKMTRGQSTRGSSHPRRHVILLTGATGNLGSHSLARLVRMSSVKKVICLARDPQRAAVAETQSNGVKGGAHLLDRLRSSLSAAGIELSHKEWAKVQMIDLKVFQTSKSEDDDSILQLAGEITHILHLAWPMDFNRTLQSFRPHLELVQSFIDLARRVHSIRPAEPRVRLLFASSIAVVRHCSNSSNGEAAGHNQPVVPETAIKNPLVAAPLGYAEAKWVCERILDYAGREFGAEIEPVVVRIGQLSGPETTEGTWKTGEHIPRLVQTSQKVGAFPLLNGTVSWLPVDRAAASVVEILLYDGHLGRFLHLENPVRQSMADISAIMAQALRLPNSSAIPFDQWLEKARQTGSLGSLEAFFADHFRDLAHGAVILDTQKSKSISKTLKRTTSIDQDLLVRYIKRWQKEGFIQ